GILQGLSFLRGTSHAASARAVHADVGARLSRRKISEKMRQGVPARGQMSKAGVTHREDSDVATLERESQWLTRSASRPPSGSELRGVEGVHGALPRILTKA